MGSVTFLKFFLHDVINFIFFYYENQNALKFYRTVCIFKPKIILCSDFFSLVFDSSTSIAISLLHLQHACESSIGKHHNPFSRFRYKHILHLLLLLRFSDFFLNIIVVVFNNLVWFVDVLGANSRRNSFQSCTLLTVGQVLSSFSFFFILLCFVSIFNKMGIEKKKKKTLLKLGFFVLCFLCIYFKWVSHGTLVTYCLFNIPSGRRRKHNFSGNNHFRFDQSDICFQSMKLVYWKNFAYTRIHIVLHLLVYYVSGFYRFQYW